MINVNRKDERFFDFMCSCSESGEQRCEDTYNNVMEELNKKAEVTDKDFTDTIVYTLAFGFNNGQAAIEGIYADMWAGIAVIYTYGYEECQKDCDYNDQDCEYSECEYKRQDFWVECDRIHHGLARAYQLVKEFDKTLDK